MFTEDDRIWSRLDEWLQLRFYHDIARDDIAAALRIHPAKLSRLMRARTGMSVREYLNSIRLDYAAKLLRDELPVEEISRRCGFSYPAYFIRLFRARYGSTPEHSATAGKTPARRESPIAKPLFHPLCRRSPAA